MRKNIYLKKVLAAALTAAVLMTDHAMVYAAETPDNLQAEMPDELQAQEFPEGADVRNPRFLEETDVWNPKFMEEVPDEDNFLFSQPLIGEEGDKTYVYEDSYGTQLTESAAVRLYNSLIDLTEEKESAVPVSMGTFLTEEGTLSGDAYEEFQLSWQTAAQNAFDAYMYDCAKAGNLDRENCRMTVHYTGQEQDDGQFMWSVSAEWELTFLEDDSDQGNWTELMELAGDSEEVPENSAEQLDVYQKLRRIYEEIQKFRLAEEESGEEKEVPPDLYARIFKERCIQEEIACVLVPGVTEEGLCVWNAVYMEDENWYAVDLLHDLFLVGADAESEDGFARSHLPYGDFSGSHMGRFALPAISESGYILPDMPETAKDEEAISAPVSDNGPVDDTAADFGHAGRDDADAGSDAAGQDDTVSGPEHDKTEDKDAEPGSTEADLPEDGTLLDEEVLETSGDETSAEQSLEGILTVSDIKDQTYTGKEIKPKITVKDAQTKKTLKANTYYTLSYENNINAGTAFVVIEGIGEKGYDGTLRVPFTILPRAVTKASAKVLDAARLYYNGQAYTPDLKLVYNKITLTQGTEDAPGDYTVTYTDNTAVGTATATVTGTGNFTGTRTVKFKIKKRPIKTMDIRLMMGSVDLLETPVQWKEGFVLPDITVACPETENVNTVCKPDRDYTVTYPKKLKAGKNTISIKGRGNYTGSVKKTFTIMKRDIVSAQVSCPYLWAYTGKNLSVRPSAVIFAADEGQEPLSLKWKTDYTVKYRSSAGKISSTVKNAGSYQMILTGKGNYQGTCMVDFCIIKDESVADNPNNSDITLPTGGEKFVLTSCRVSFCEKENNLIKVTLTANRNETLEHLKDTFHIAMLDSTKPQILKASEGIVDVQTQEDVFSIEAEFLSDDALGSEIMSRYAVAVEVEKGKYQLLSSGTFLENPEAVSSAKKDKYWGYYENYKITSKKGIQGIDDAYTYDLRAQHILLNIDMAELIGQREEHGYKPYIYKGKTYYFREQLREAIYNLNGWGNRDYGPMTRNVTAVFLLSWKDELSYLIHPSARKKGAAPYYALNMQEQKAKDTFEALFCWMGETYAEDYKYRIENWTLGNEVNSCKAWNYSGSMSLKDCVENYAEAFKLLHQGVRRSASSPRLFISLDHCWTASEAGHSGKAFLDEFAAYMNQTAPDMQWNVNYHAYAQPLTRSRFWADTSNTTNAVNTKYISMKNIQVLTDYLSSLEVKYHKPDKSIRVILGEHGYSARYGDDAKEADQAASLGYGYYIAMFNDRIDAHIIRAYLDDETEIKGGLFLGLRDRNEGQKDKESYGVYKYIDTDQSLKRMNKYLSLIGISDWKQKIPNFDSALLDAKLEE